MHYGSQVRNTREMRRQFGFPKVQLRGKFLAVIGIPLYHENESAEGRGIS